MVKKLLKRIVLVTALLSLLSTTVFAMTAEPSKSFVFDSKTGTITKYIGKERAVVVPSTINGKKVVAIGKRAFTGYNYKAQKANSNAKDLMSVTIPESVTTIGDEAFSYRPILRTVTLPSSLKTLGKGAFTGCRALQSIVIPTGVKKLQNFTFQDCSTLIDVTIPTTVTSFGNSVFHGCKSLSNIVIPSSVTTLGNYSFEECTSLTSVTIPSTVTTIGSFTFYKSDKVTIHCEKGSYAEKFANDYGIPLGTVQ